MSDKPTVVVDIETYSPMPSPNQIEAFSNSWVPGDARWKEDTVERKRQEAVSRWIEKSALDITRAKVVSVALCQISDSGKVFDLAGEASMDEKAVIEFFSEYLNELASGCRLVGFNLEAFDLPILCRGLYTHSFSLEFPIDRWGVLDLMKKPTRVSMPLKQYIKMFGIERDPEVEDVTGKEVAKLVERGELDKLLLYNKEDVRITAQLYVALTRMFQL